MLPFKIDVLAAGQFRVKAGPDLEQAADPSSEFGPARRRLGDPAEDLQERRLAGPVAADDPDDLSRLDLERDVLERPEISARLITMRRSSRPCLPDRQAG